MATKELRVLTLNCWGLPVVSKHRQERITSIAEELARGRYDIVALQEVWRAKDYKFIQETTNSVLPYSHYFHGGMVGGGVCIFSKGPIVDTFYHSFRLNGYCQHIHHGDWYAGKMIGMCVIRHQGLTIKVYTTHLHALYAPSMEPAADQHLSHRLVQAYELSEFVHHTYSGCDLALVMGDLNTEPGSLAFKIIKSNGLTDAWEVRKNRDKDQPSTTCESSSNAYTFIKRQYYHDKTIDGARIDYVLYRADPNTIHIACKNAQLAFQKIPNTAGMNYSDHEGVETTFEFTRTTDSSRNSTSTAVKDNARLQALTKLLPHVQMAKDTATNHKMWYLIKAICILVFMIFLNSMSTLDTGYLGCITHVINIGLVLMLGYFFCAGVVVRQTEKNILTGVEKDVKLRIDLLSTQDLRF